MSPPVGRHGSLGTAADGDEGLAGNSETRKPYVRPVLLSPPWRTLQEHSESEASSKVGSEGRRGRKALAVRGSGG